MPTIKDIARAAGVSHATVSNVLNKKGNVSAEKVKLVLDAAASMGYHVNEAASALRSGSTQMMAVILPDTGSAAYDDLYRSLRQVADEHGYGILLRLTDNVPAQEMRAIQDALAARVRCAVVVTSLPDAAERYRILTRAGTEVVFVDRGEQAGYLYAGFDLPGCARALARRVIGDGAARIGLMIGMAGYPSQAAFRDAFMEEAAGCRVKCVQSISAQYDRRAFSLFDQECLDAVVTSSEEMARAVLRAGAILEQRPRVYTLAPRRVLYSDEYTVYALDYRLLGLKLGRMLLDEQAERRNIPGGTTGFAPRFARISLPAAHELSLMTADTPVIRAVERLLPRLKQDTGLSLSITALPTQEASRMLARADVVSRYDLARMDMSLMDRWAPGLFVPLEEMGASLTDILPRLLPGIAQEYSLAGGRYRALPLDPGCHLLFYRKDLLDDPVLQRKYFEAYHEPLTVPADYASFLRVAEFFAGADIRSYGVRHPVILTRRASECVSNLASLSPNGHWPYLSERDLEDYIRRQRALECCAAFVENGSWGEAVSRFARGECAMLIAHSNYARHLADEPLSTVSGHVGYSASPGVKYYLSGGSIGVLAPGAHREAAAAFLSWLFSPQISQIVALLSGCSPLASVYESEELADIYPWLSTVRTGLINGVRRRLLVNTSANIDCMALEKQIAWLCNQTVCGAMPVPEAVAALNALVFHG